MRNISPEGEICCFLCSACNITHVVSTVKRRVLIFFCKEFVNLEFVNPFFLLICVIIWTNSYSFLDFTIFNGCLSGLMQR